jgi:hypothetical protein
VRNEGHQLANFRRAADRQCLDGIPVTVPTLRPSGAEADRRQVTAAARVGDQLVRFAAVRPPSQYADDYRALISAWRDLALGIQSAAGVRGTESSARQKAWELQARKIAASTERIQAAALPMGLFGCSTRAATMQVAATQALVLGRFRTRGRYGSATVRG